MGRFPQSPGRRGSKKWIQILVNKQPELLGKEIKTSLGLDQDESICWCSPLEKDEYAEYRDQAFLDRLSIKLEKVPLDTFWPQRGPQWDALGKGEEDKIFLVEAKTHIGELVSSLRAKNPNSLEKIGKSLEDAKRFFGSSVESDWSSPFYQYTNRLAHLYLLRVLNDVPAYLVFIYFINDVEMGGPRTVAEWKREIDRLHSYLRISRHKLEQFVTNIFIDVDCL